MNKLTLAGALFALTLAATTASAAGFTDFRVKAPSDQVNIVQQGVYSASIQASVSSTSGSGINTTTATTIALGGSTFISKEVELQLSVMYTGVSGGANSTSVVGGARYYFDPSQDKQVLPFVGVLIGYQSTSGGGNNNTIYGADAGVQYFLAPNVSLTPQVVYLHTTSSGNNFNTWQFQLGLTFWFNK